MPKAFARISANELEEALDNFNLPEKLVDALKEAIINARTNDEMCGEAPIQVFITADEEEDDE